MDLAESHSSNVKVDVNRSLQCHAHSLNLSATLHRTEDYFYTAATPTTKATNDTTVRFLFTVRLTVRELSGMYMELISGGSLESLRTHPDSHKHY